MVNLDVRTVRAVCPHDCPDTCGMVVTVRDGKAVDLRGDKDHPFTRGFLCKKVARYLDRTYHADRLKFPMRRAGPKGAGQFERISWDEAVETVSRRFREIAASADGPQSILPYSYAGTMGKLQGSSLDRRFFHRLGASLLDRTICATAGAAGSDITLGTRAVLDPDAIVHARTIINWGSNTSVTNIHLWSLMYQARKRGAKIITIDPQKSPTAARSDWWIAIRPGTDAALALGVMHVIWREDWQDDAYLNDYCLGGDLLKERTLKDYPPDKVAAITGVTVSEIERLARDIARSREDRGGPSFIRLNYGLQRHRGGGMAVRTVTCIPAVTGEWRYPGGGAFLSTSKLSPWNNAALERPDLIPPGTRTINMVQLAEALAGELPGPPVKALYVYNSNPAAVCPDQSRVLAGLRREDLFTVVHEQFPTDTADYADILLPATTQLEHFDIHNAYGHLYIQTNERAIDPLFEAKSNTDVFRLLAEAMGFEPEIFAVSDDELARQSLEAPTNGRYPPASAFAGISLDRLHRDGPLHLNLPAEYAPFAHGEFGTASGKCELYSPELARRGLDPLPNYTPPHEDPQTRPDLAAKYPLQMICPPDGAFLNSSFANLQSQRDSAGEPRIVIHPDDAAKRGISDGQMVRMINDRGAFEAKAVVGDMVKAGVVVTFSVWWNKFASDRRNCNTVTSTALTDFGAGATFFDNLVEVEPLAA